jgi:hypothetical protein
MGIGQLPTIAVSLVVAGIVFAIGLQIASDTGSNIGEDDCAGYWNESSDTCQTNSTSTTQLSANSGAYNATSNTVEGMGKVTGKFPLIGTVVAAVIVLGLVIGGLQFRNR